MKDVLIYKAISKRETPIEVRVKAIHSEDIPSNKLKCIHWCKKCSNFGAGGCNPKSPDIEALKEGYKMAVVVSLRLYFKDFKSTETPKTNAFLKMFQVHRLLSNTCVKLGSVLSRSTLSKPNMFLATGYCKGCSPCKFKTLGICTSPEKRTFSMESTGILVTKLVPQLFGYELQWFTREGVKSGNTPDYMNHTFAVLLPEKYSHAHLETLTFNAIREVFKKKRERGII